MADIVFLLDIGSSSNWGKVLEFLSNFVSSSAGSTRFGLISFSDGSAISYFYLNTFGAQSELLSAIRTIPYTGVSVRLVEGVREMSNEQFSITRGDRNGIGNIGIILTDRESNNTDANIRAAKDAITAGTTMYTIGISGNVIRDEIRLAIVHHTSC